MIDTYYLEDEYGIQALNENINLQRPFGYGVVTGCKVSSADGVLAPDQPDEHTLRVTAGTAVVGGSVVSISAANINLEASDTEHRWDLIYVAPDGTLNVQKGDPESADPPVQEVDDVQKVERPAPPDLSSLTGYSSGLPLAIVWVEGGSSTIDNTLVFDRRVPNTFSIDDSGNVRLYGTDLLDGAGNTIFDQTSNFVPLSILEADTVTVAGNVVTLGGSTGVAYIDLSDTGTSFPIPNTDLANSSVTVAGNSVSLGGSTTVSYPDLSDTAASFPIPNGDLANSSVTVAGQNVSLGGSTGIALGDLSNVTATGEGSGGGFDADLLDGVELANIDWADVAMTQSDVSVSDLGAADAVYDTSGFDIVDGTTTIWDSTSAFIPQAQLGGPASSLSAYPLANSDLANSSVTIAGNSVSLGGSTTPTLDDFGAPAADVGFGGNSLTAVDILQLFDASGNGITWSATEAANDSLHILHGGSIALEITDTEDVVIPSGDLIDASGNIIYDTSGPYVPQERVEKTGFNADQIDGYDVQKNGTDGAGIINFKT